MSASTCDEAKTSAPRIHAATISDVLNSDHQIDNAALVLLNVPLNKSAVERLWKACSRRLCADGAASRLCELNTGSDGPDLVPDVITGDMDSASPTVSGGGQSMCMMCRTVVAEGALLAPTRRCRASWRRAPRWSRILTRIVTTWTSASRSFDSNKKIHTLR